MIEAFRNAFRVPDVRNRLLITGLIIVIYQFATHVPVVGVDGEALNSVLNSQVGGGIIQTLNLLSGGAVRNFSVIANGVYPYITASIIFQLLVPIVPQLEAIQREPGGQEKIQRYTYYLAIPMAVLQAFGQIQVFGGIGGQAIIPGFGEDLILTLAVLSTMTAGTMFAIWLGELITEQGIGNGISIIIFSGIISQAPGNLVRLINGTHKEYHLILFVLIVVVSVVGIIFVQEGVRRIPVQYGKRVRGRKQYGGASTHIPLKVNPVGMIPLIFAQSLIAFPGILVAVLVPSDTPFAQSFNSTFGQQRGELYWLSFFLLVVGFTFFYTDVMVGNQNLAENLQRNGGFIPGIRPGKRTQEYIVSVTRRITIVGALFLGIIAIVPYVVSLINALFFPQEYGLTLTATNTANAAQVLSGSGLIIVVGVVIDTLRQLEAQLMMRNYEGFINR
jgi:preprotein translocase subunit SecY